MVMVDPDGSINKIVYLYFSANSLCPFEKPFSINKWLEEKKHPIIYNKFIIL